MADYSNWMAELDKYASSGPAGGGTANMSASLAASSTVSAGGTRSTVEELEAVSGAGDCAGTRTNLCCTDNSVCVTLPAPSPSSDRLRR